MQLSIKVGAQQRLCNSERQNIKYWHINQKLNFLQHFTQNTTKNIKITDLSVPNIQFLRYLFLYSMYLLFVDPGLLGETFNQR